jgi:hypothetical protein
MCQWYWRAPDHVDEKGIEESEGQHPPQEPLNLPLPTSLSDFVPAGMRLQYRTDLSLDPCLLAEKGCGI